MGLTKGEEVNCMALSELLWLLEGMEKLRDIVPGGLGRGDAIFVVTRGARTGPAGPTGTTKLGGLGSS